MSIHKRIKQRRETLGLTMEEVATALGVKWQTIQQWEKADGTAPKRTRLEQVAIALLTTPEYLLYGTDAAGEPWPFAEWIDIERVKALSRDDLIFVAGKLDAALQEREHKPIKRSERAS